MEIILLTGYVDDIRKSGTCVRLGLRFIVGAGWKWSEADYQEDLEMRRTGESRNSRMVRICMPLVNSINQDLEFTSETPEDFDGKRLPTLDFEIWQEKDGKINHNYFQKDMKNPFQIMKRSAISQHSKISITSNELLRRLGNTNSKNVDNDESSKVVETFIKEMKHSEYSRKEVKEVVCSAITGWKRKVARREKEGQSYYKSARSTLVTRCMKKLTEKTNWHKRSSKSSKKDGDQPKDEWRRI